MKRLTDAKVRMYQSMLEKLRRWTETDNPDKLLEQDFPRYMKMFDKLASLLADNTSCQWDLADSRAQVAQLQSQIERYAGMDSLLTDCLNVIKDVHLRDRLRAAIRIVTRPSIYDKKPNTKPANNPQRETPLQPAGL